MHQIPASVHFVPSVALHPFAALAAPHPQPRRGQAHQQRHSGGEGEQPSLHGKIHHITRAPGMRRLFRQVAGDNAGVTAIRVIFDGKSFVPQQPVSLPAQSEAIVIIDQTEPAAEAQLDAAVRAYYQAGSDSDEDAWGDATSPQSHRAWDED